jgi:hypothetical protein
MLSIKSIPLGRTMTAEEANEWLEKVGGREEYDRQVREDQPEPQVTEKSVAQVMVDYFEVVAKAKRITLEEFFRQNPVEYEKYRRTVQGIER